MYVRLRTFFPYFSRINYNLLIYSSFKNNWWNNQVNYYFVCFFSKFDDWLLTNAFLKMLSQPHLQLNHQPNLQPNNQLQLQLNRDLQQLFQPFRHRHQHQWQQEHHCQHYRQHQHQHHHLVNINKNSRIELNLFLLELKAGYNSRFNRQSHKFKWKKKIFGTCYAWTKFFAL